MKDLNALPMWQLVALGAFVVAAGVAFVLYLRGKKKK
jgi:hypothetical protein